MLLHTLRGAKAFTLIVLMYKSENVNTSCIIIALMGMELSC